MKDEEVYFLTQRHVDFSHNSFDRMSEGKTFGFYIQTQWFWNVHLFNDVAEKDFKLISRLDLKSSISCLGPGFSSHAWKRNLLWFFSTF